MAEGGTDDVLMTIQRNILTVANQLQQDNPNRQQLRVLITQSQRNLDRVSSTDRSMFVDVHGALHDLMLLIDRPAPDVPAAEVPVPLGRNEHFDGSPRGRGRPMKEIDLHFVKDQLKNGFTAKAIAEQLNCSAALLYKALRSNGVSVRGLKYTSISDADLQDAIGSLHQSHPNSGNEMMNGYLMAQGIQVQRRRVRETLTAVDPQAAAQRWSMSISRRVYSVPVPNSLWHMDGHMRLIRWGIVTHGCIDGYSRTIIYLQAGTNNRSSTVLELFVDGVLRYGLPSFVRSDKGGENVQVGLFMNLMRDQETGGCLTGRSVHNQRIERMWRDVHKDVIDKFYREFYKLEDEAHLDPDNNVHITAIQLAYLPDINRSLGELRHGWNNHRLRTERNRTPNQVWFEGMVSHSDHTPVRELQTDSNLSEDICEKLNSFGLTLQDVQPQAQIRDAERVEVQRASVDLPEDFVGQLALETTHMQSREKYIHYVSRINDHLS